MKFKHSRYWQWLIMVNWCFHIHSYPAMDGLFQGKSHEQMDDEGVHTYFRKPPLFGLNGIRKITFQITPFLLGLPCEFCRISKKKHYFWSIAWVGNNTPSYPKILFFFGFENQSNPAHLLFHGEAQRPSWHTNHTCLDDPTHLTIQKLT